MDLQEMPQARFVRHPWERARAGFFADLLVRELPRRRSVTALDVGAGDGWFAGSLVRRLPPGSSVACWDVGYTSEVLERLGSDEPRLSFQAGRPDGRFDLILLLDVLEHVEDDRGLLGTLVAENLAPGGRVLAAVPAWERLRSLHDDRLLHLRRYSPRRLGDLLAACGLTPIRRGGLFSSLLVARALAKVRERVLRETLATPRPLEWRHGETGARLVEAFLRADALAGRLSAAAGVPLPGLSVWALCRTS